MAPAKHTVDIPLTADKSISSRHDSLLEIGFQIGLALFVLAISWVLWLELPESFTPLAVWFVLLTLGIALAGVTWVASSNLSIRTKAIASIAIMTVAISTPTKYVMQRIADQEILRPGRIERGRFRHESLGLSFNANASMWLMPLLNVVVRQSNSQSIIFGDRLHYGDEATLFRVASPNDPDGQRSPIILRVIPFRYSRLDDAVAHAVNTQAHFASQQGERLTRPVHRHQIGTLDVIDFELYFEPWKLHTRYVFIRSGSYLLLLELRSRNPQYRAEFDEFVKSIEITGRTTRFDS